jgi:PAS domain-containing protein
MPESRPRPRKAPQPGWLALNACGDGFWEFDLLSGSAWFSDWFYRKLGWSEARRSMLDLQPLMRPVDWEELMRKLRGQLEQAQPLDLELRVRVADSLECWQLRGTAQRNAAGQPIGLAGSARQVSENCAPEQRPSLACYCAAFDALPVAAALIDAQSVVLAANRKWREIPEPAAAHVIRCLLASGPTEEWLALEHDAALGSSSWPLRARAAPFHHEGLRHLVMMLEER